MTCSLEIGNGRQFGQTELKEKPAKLVQEITSLKFQIVNNSFCLKNLIWKLENGMLGTFC